MSDEKLKVFGLHTETTTVGAYRMWSPFHWLNKLGLAEAKHLSIDDPDEHFALEKKDPKYDPKVGCYDEMGEWADVILRQKISTIIEDSIALAVRHKHKVPLVVDSDDDLLHTHRTNPVFNEYTEKSLSELFDVKKINDFERQKHVDEGYVVYHMADGMWAFKEKDDSVRVHTMSLMREADAVTVSTPTLYNLYQKYNKNIYLLPNYIDFDRWEGVTKAEHAPDRVRIGWYGGQSHYDDLAILEAVIPAILEKYPQVDFVWCGITPDYWLEWLDKYKDSDRLLHFPWAQKVWEWEKHFASFGLDIAMAPLVDTQFNRAKSNIKWMESAVLGIPVVASPVEPYLCIKHGKDGFLANNFKDWMTYLGKLIKDADLRKQVGEAARERVKKDFNMETQAYKWRDAYQDIRLKYSLKSKGLTLR